MVDEKSHVGVGVGTVGSAPMVSITTQDRTTYLSYGYAMHIAKLILLSCDLIKADHQKESTNEDTPPEAQA